MGLGNRMELSQPKRTRKMEEKKASNSSCLTANYWRYCLSAFVHNFSGYFYWLLIPLVAQDLGCPAWELGLVQSLASLTYTVFAIVTGSLLVERLRVGILSRIAVIAFAGACVSSMFANRVWMLFPIVFVSASGNALFWTPVQNAVGREAGDKVDKRVSLFSVWHALGK